MSATILSLSFHLLFLFQNSKNDMCNDWDKDKLETNHFHGENDEKVRKLMNPRYQSHARKTMEKESK